MKAGRRTYDQACGVAWALDQVGERWTLLLIRDLMLGPKRHKDLLEGLPGIPTNLLAQRLRELEAAGVIEQVTLPPPAGSTVYQLTSLGAGLEPAVLALGRWGHQVAGTGRVKGVLLPGPFFVSLRASFDPEAAKGLKATYEFRADGRVFELRIADQRCVTQDGAPSRPDAVITADVMTLSALRRRELSAEDAVRRGRATIEGDRTALRRFVELFAWHDAGKPAHATPAARPAPR